MPVPPIPLVFLDLDTVPPVLYEDAFGCDIPAEDLRYRIGLRGWLDPFYGGRIREKHLEVCHRVLVDACVPRLWSFARGLQLPTHDGFVTVDLAGGKRSVTEARHAAHLSTEQGLFNGALIATMRQPTAQQRDMHSMIEAMASAGRGPFKNHQLKGTARRALAWELDGVLARSSREIEAAHAGSRGQIPIIGDTQPGHNTVGHALTRATSIIWYGAASAVVHLPKDIGRTSGVFVSDFLQRVVQAVRTHAEKRRAKWHARYHR